MSLREAADTEYRPWLNKNLDGFGKQHRSSFIFSYARELHFQVGIVTVILVPEWLRLDSWQFPFACYFLVSQAWLGRSGRKLSTEGPSHNYGGQRIDLSLTLDFRIDIAPTTIPYLHPSLTSSPSPDWQLSMLERRLSNQAGRKGFWLW